MTLRRCSSVSISIALLVAACATSSARRDDIVEDGIVFPIGMCAKHGTVVTSNDAPGKKMYCEQVEPTGSHLPQCVCWDERILARNRAAAQQALREYE
jgi:hypothetical protein